MKPSKRHHPTPLGMDFSWAAPTPSIAFLRLAWEVFNPSETISKLLVLINDDRNNKPVAHIYGAATLSKQKGSLGSLAVSWDMGLLSLTLKGAQRTSHQVRLRQKVVPWLYLCLVWCSMFRCMLPGASSNKSITTVGQSGTSGAWGKRHQALHQAHAGAAQTLQPPSSLGRAKSFPPTWRQNLVLEKRAMPHIQPAPEGCGRMHVYAFMGRTHRNNTRLATGSTNTYMHGLAGTYNDGSHNRPVLRATAHSLEFTSPSLACKGWDISLPQRHRQGLCRVHSRSPAGTAWPPLQLCPRN